MDLWEGVFFEKWGVLYACNAIIFFNYDKVLS